MMARTRICRAISVRHFAFMLTFIAMACGAVRDGSAQTPKEASEMLFKNIAPADEQLRDAFDDAIENKSATKQQVMTVFTRGFPYYEQRNYFTASQLFGLGIPAYTLMSWPEDEPQARAYFYYSKSLKAFCETDATLCKLFHTHEYRGDLNFPEAAAWEHIVGAYAVALRLPAFPADLKADAARECLEAQARYRGLVQSNPGYLRTRGGIIAEAFGGRRSADEYKCE